MIIFAIILIIFLSKEAHAYVDPGVGSQLIQIIIGALVVVGFTLRAYWQRLVSSFKKSKEQKDQIQK